MMWHEWSKIDLCYIISLLGMVSLKPSENAPDGARKVTNTKENNSRMKTEKVDKRYVIRVTEEESKMIEKRFELSKINSMSAYLRQQVVNGIYLEYDHEELAKIRQTIMSVANNINQIAHRVNSTSHIYKQEILDLQEGVNELWRQLQSIQSELQRLNPSHIS